MRPNARLLAAVAFLTLGAVTAGAPTPVFAQSADALQAERTRLRTQLDKVNAEIDGLKRAGGGVRDDYRLRARLADAESLARRLMDIEARLGIHLDATAKNQPPPTAAPSDGPADLDAKADILADQARRVRAQAEALGRRAVDAKGRQELRKRAADLDRDPFAPMEGSKRRVVSSAGVAPSGGSNRTQAGATDLAPQPPVAPTGANGSNTSSAGLTPAAMAPLSVQLRDLLDTATLTDVRRLETTGAAAVSPQALERASIALRARADWLDAQSRAMRARSKAK
jgi:hypothetical protein